MKIFEMTNGIHVDPDEVTDNDCSHCSKGLSAHDTGLYTCTNHEKIYVKLRDFNYEIYSKI